MKRKNKRRKMREKVLQILYAYELNKDGLEALVTSVLSDVENVEEREFARSIVDRVIIHAKELDEELVKRVDNWEFSRIALIDKILIKIGICEFLYFDDIPPKVTINEAIEISKEYSTAKSGRFINGILDGAYLEFKELGRLSKKGRGLIDETLPKTDPIA